MPIFLWHVILCGSRYLSRNCVKLLLGFQIFVVMQLRITRTLSQFIFVFIGLSFVPTLYFINELQKIKQDAYQKVEQSERTKLEFAKTELTTLFSQAAITARELATAGALNRTILSPTPENIDTVEEFWLLVARTKKLYATLRYIDEQGNEVIRINKNDNITEIVAKDRLQDQSAYDYFRFAQAQTANQLSLNGIHLKTEKQKLLGKNKPSLQFIFPIEIAGKRRGYFVADLNFDYLYRMLAYNGDLNERPDVFEGSGNLVLSRENNNISANQYVSLSHYLPSLWQSINTSNQGTIHEEDVWYSFTKALLQTENDSLEIILINSADQSEITGLYYASLSDLFLLAGSIYLTTLFITFSFITWNYHHQKNSLESQIARAAMNGMSAMVITDRNNRIIRVNEEFIRVSGFKEDEVVGKQPSIFSSGKHHQEFYIKLWKELELKGLWEGEVVNRRKDGSLITEILRIQTVKDTFGTIQFYVASFVDISHRKELEIRLKELSEKDSLTSLWNRRKFDNTLVNDCAKVKRYHSEVQMCLSVIDIDLFKRINDELGHDEGDRVIQFVANTLQKSFRETDFVSRIGGEEFAIIMPHTNINEAELVLNRIRTSIYLESNYKVSISAGITELCSSPKLSYKRADVALYEAKNNGRNCIELMRTTESDSIA
ncbi:sensor domain-containing diguanylate cyclase [Vibrio sp. TRT 17S01]|uniref:sensor domain-containing diguanylate cyclase n=1 Tax=Vibrio sp. TRT 17S01 TaxID=3418505 RepID=UPI003CF5B020